MKSFLSIIFSCILLSAHSQQLIVDPNAQMRVLSGSFNSIKVSGGIEVFLSQSTEEAVAISASEIKYMEDIKTVVENNTLKISSESKWYGKNKKMKVYISFKNLESITVSGACDIKVSGSLKIPSLKIDFSGASEFTGNVQVDQLDLHLSGASDITISGSAKNVNINSSGASDIKAKKLTTETCQINVSGASDVDIVVNKEINAVASGASSVTYSGNATVGKIVKTGASSISKRS